MARESSGFELASMLVQIHFFSLYKPSITSESTNQVRLSPLAKITNKQTSYFVLTNIILNFCVYQLMKRNLYDSKNNFTLLILILANKAISSFI